MYPVSNISESIRNIPNLTCNSQACHQGLFKKNPVNLFYTPAPPHPPSHTHIHTCTHTHTHTCSCTEQFVRKPQWNTLVHPQLKCKKPQKNSSIPPNGTLQFLPH